MFSTRGGLYAHKRKSRTHAVNLSLVPAVLLDHEEDDIMARVMKRRREEEAEKSRKCRRIDQEGSSHAEDEHGENGEGEMIRDAM